MKTKSEAPEMTAAQACEGLEAIVNAAGQLSAEAKTYEDKIALIGIAASADLIKTALDGHLASCFNPAE